MSTISNELVKDLRMAFSVWQLAAGLKVKGE